MEIGKKAEILVLNKYYLFNMFDMQIQQSKPWCLLLFVLVHAQLFFAYVMVGSAFNMHWVCLDSHWTQSSSMLKLQNLVSPFLCWDITFSFTLRQTGNQTFTKYWIIPNMCFVQYLFNRSTKCPCPYPLLYWKTEILH